MSSPAASPLSCAQEMLWLLDRATPGMNAYNSPVAFSLHGRFDIGIFRRALLRLVERHHALRSIIVPQDDRAVSVVQPIEFFELRFLDVSEMPEDERNGATDAFLLAVAQQAFDLAHDIPFRAGVVKLAFEEHAVVFVTHHIASDAWSYGIILRELSAFYEQECTASSFTPAAVMQFGDIAAAQRLSLQTGAFESGFGFWRSRIQERPSLDLPSDFTRSKGPTAEGACVTAAFSPEQVAQLKDMAAEQATTLYGVLLTAYHGVLRRYTAQSDVIVGCAISGRTQPAFENVVGYFSPALPVRVKAEVTSSFRALLEQTSDELFAVLEHQSVPLEPLLFEQKHEREQAQTPLFSAVLTMQDALEQHWGIAGLTVTAKPLLLASTKFDLTLLATERAGGVDLTLWFRRDLFATSTAERFLGHFQALLLSALTARDIPISQLPMLSEAEHAQITTWSAGVPSLSVLNCVHEHITAQAQRTPDRIAVVATDATLSYAQLDARSNAVAHALRAAGVHRGAPVGLAVERSAAAIIGLLAILKAGGAYVPLQPEFPLLRLHKYILATGLRTIICLQAFAERLQDTTLNCICLDTDALPLALQSAEPVEHEASLDDPAYILFTSGSTGEPKGVQVTHRNIASYTAAFLERLGLRSKEHLRFAFTSTLAADLGNTAVFPALTSGGILYCVPPEQAADPVAFAAYMTENIVDCLKITPSHFAALFADGNTGVLPHRWLILGGETLERDLAAKILATRSCLLVNHYGPTEATVGACTFEVTAEWLAQTASTVVPLGLPLPNVYCRVLSASGVLQPVGVPGELYIGGMGVAAGYIDLPEMTRQRFLLDPFVQDSPKKMYRTGDRVRWLASGQLEFLGRIDHQVKVRGYRVELGEIESMLHQHPAVQTAAVDYQTFDHGGEILRAAVTLRPDAILTDVQAPTILRAWLSESLPAYMVPETIVCCDAFPMTGSGKIDRKALFAPPKTFALDEDAAMVSDTERKMRAIWLEVLKIEHIGLDEAFLDVGGHSIVAIRLLGKVSRTFGVRLALRTLFEHATIRCLSRIVDEAGAHVSA